MSVPVADAGESQLSLLLTRHRPTLRVCFWFYALSLFTVTHWPALELNVPHVERPDLIIHFVCFGGWFGAFWVAAYIGPSLQLRSIALAVAVAVLYAGFDEGLQSIPFVRRHCAWDDFLANCGGVLLASLLALAITLVAARTRSALSTSGR